MLLSMFAWEFAQTMTNSAVADSFHPSAAASRTTYAQVTKKVRRII